MSISLPLPRIKIVGTEFRRLGSRWKGWGSQQLDGDFEEAYITSTGVNDSVRSVMKNTFSGDHANGCNIIRYRWDLWEMLDVNSPDAANITVNEATMSSLIRVLDFARKNNMYVLLSGCRQTSILPHSDGRLKIPAWYNDTFGDTDPKDRWDVHQFVWEEVAKRIVASKNSSTLLGYELINEPIISSDASASWLGPLSSLGSDLYFSTVIARGLTGAPAMAAAVDWMTQLKNAIKAIDSKALVTVGVFPFGGTSQPFGPTNSQQILDFLSPHFYPSNLNTPSSAPTQLQHITDWVTNSSKPIVCGEYTSWASETDNIAHWNVLKTAVEAVVSFSWGYGPDAFAPANYEPYQYPGPVANGPPLVGSAWWQRVLAKARLIFFTARRDGFLYGYRRKTFTDPDTKRITLDGNPTTVWRLTHDSTVRDYINYHNTQCWSHDGRYVCVERWVEGAASENWSGKSSIQIYIMDLETDSEIYIDNGMAPRWAKLSNKLFYAHFTGNGDLNWETGIENRMYDCTQPENGLVVVAYGMQELGETSIDDQYLYGVRRFPVADSPTGRERVPVRVKIELGGPSDIDTSETDYWLMLGSGNGTRPLPSRKYPVIAQRAKQDLTGDGIVDKEGFDQSRSFSDLDGGNERTGTLLTEGAHQAWSGDGEWWILGNMQLRGRSAAEGLGTDPNNPDSIRNGHSGQSGYPSNTYILSHGRTSDPGECGQSGRWISNGGGVCDIRTGGSWEAISPKSQIVYPEGVGDVSEPYDSDAKGSPDGTKICFLSNLDLARPEIAYCTVAVSSATGNPDLQVDNTAAFPSTGYLVHKTEIIYYSGKTATSFGDSSNGFPVTRGSLKTQIRGIDAGGVFTLLDARVIPLGLRNTPNMPNFMNGPALGDTFNDSSREGAIEYFPDGTGDLAHQQMTDVYVSIVRKPDAPYLRDNAGQMELVPGENHRETAGYRIFKIGADLGETLISGAALIQPGASFTLLHAGTYTARAVEKSSLEGHKSNDFVITTARVLDVLDAIPAGFDWFTYEWKVDGSVVTESQAKAAAVSSHLKSHRSEGLLSTETWNLDKLIQRDTQDYFGVVCIKEYYTENSAGVNRISLKEFYRDPDNVTLYTGDSSLWQTYAVDEVEPKKGIVSEEIFDIETGWKLSMKQWRYYDKL